MYVSNVGLRMQLHVASFLKHHFTMVMLQLPCSHKSKQQPHLQIIITINSFIHCLVYKTSEISEKCQTQFSRAQGDTIKCLVFSYQQSKNKDIVFTKMLRQAKANSQIWEVEMIKFVAILLEKSWKLIFYWLTNLKCCWIVKSLT